MASNNPGLFLNKLYGHNYLFNDRHVWNLLTFSFLRTCFKRRNYRIQGHSFPYHWITKAVIVICLVQQKILTNLHMIQPITSQVCQQLLYQLTNQIAHQSFGIFKFTWLWRWLLHKMLKHQSPTTVLLRTPVAPMIFLNQDMLLLGSSRLFLFAFS